MNKTIRRAAVFTLLLVLSLLVRATWVQFYDGKALADDKSNRRNAIEQYANPLGNIIVAGRAITGSAQTKGSDLKYKRTYTDGSLYAAVTGYSSQVRGDPAGGRLQESARRYGHPAEEPPRHDHQQACQPW
jgi:hypothetical protein